MDYSRTREPIWISRCDFIWNFTTPKNKLIVALQLYITCAHDTGAHSKFNYMYFVEKSLNLIIISITFANASKYHRVSICIIVARMNKYGLKDVMLMGI